MTTKTIKPNKAHWERVLNAIKRAEQLNMHVYRYWPNDDDAMSSELYGTPACIAGHAFVQSVMMHDGLSYDEACKSLMSTRADSIEHEAADYLEVPWELAGNLFTGFFNTGERSDNGRANRVEVIEAMQRVLNGEPFEQVIGVAHGQGVEIDQAE